MTIQKNELSEIQATNDLILNSRAQHQNLSSQQNFPLSYEYFEKIRPGHVNDAIIYAQKFGATHQQSKIINDAIQHLINEFEKRQERYSDNTLEQLKTNWGIFVNWCTNNEKNALPASPDILEEFIVEKEDELHRNSIKSYLWSISKMHRVTGCPDPTLDEMVKDRAQGIFRKKAKRGEQINQASALRERHLDKLTSQLRYSNLLLNRRNLAVLTIAYETMLRASELVSIRFRHITILDDGSAVIEIPITKTNHSGEPDVVKISVEAVEILYEYIDMANLSPETKDSFIFVGVTKHNNAIKPKLVEDKKTKGSDYRSLTTRTIENIFAEAWKVLNLHKLGIAVFSGHSARVGACQDLLTEGYSILQVQQAGRWSSPAMVMRYGRNILAQDSAMAIKRAQRGKRS